MKKLEFSSFKWLLIVYIAIVFGSGIYFDSYSYGLNPKEHSEILSTGINNLLKIGVFMFISSLLLDIKQYLHHVANDMMEINNRAKNQK